MNWLVLTIMSALAGSLTKISQKVLLSNEKSDPYAFAFIFQLTVAGLFLAYTLVTNTLEFPNLSGLLLNLIIMTLFYSLGNLMTFKAFKLIDASEVGIIYASSTAWSVISALLFLGEQISWLNVLGIGLIILGVIAINYSPSQWKISQGHGFALFGALLFGLAFTNDAYIIERYTSVASYMIPAFTLPGIVVLLYHPKSARSLNHFFSMKVFFKLLFTSIFYALAAITIFTAYKWGGQASIISPISQTSIIFTVVLGYLFLKERNRLPNKIIGMILAFSGVLLLV